MLLPKYFFTVFFPVSSHASVPGAILVSQPLDYETCRDYFLTVEARDGGTPSLSAITTVNINITDVNDNAPVFSCQLYTAVVSEDAATGDSVIQVCLGSEVNLCTVTPIFREGFYIYLYIYRVGLCSNFLIIVTVLRPNRGLLIEAGRLYSPSFNRKIVELHL